MRFTALSLTLPLALALGCGDSVGDAFEEASGTPDASAGDAGTGAGGRAGGGGATGAGGGPSGGATGAGGRASGGATATDGGASGGASGTDGGASGGASGTDGGASGGSSSAGGASGAGGAGPNLCGNGVLDLVAGEECDDGPRAAGDGCDDNCQLEPVGATCGDTNVDPLEKCDGTPGCNPTCNFTATVTTLATGLPDGIIAADDSYLWLSNPAACTVERIDLDACIATQACSRQVIAGTGTCGPLPVDGNGTAAVLSQLGTMTTNGITVWFADRHTIRALDVASGAVTTLAGDPTLCGGIDGTGASATFNDIRGLTFHAGRLYVLDSCENMLRVVDPGTGVVTHLAGRRQVPTGAPATGSYSCTSNFTCVSGTPADGTGKSAVFGSPRYMAADNSGSLYITDTNGELLRRYDLTTTEVTTIAGGTQGYRDGVHAPPGSPVLIDRPRGMISDGTSLYWAEQNAATVRQFEIATSTATTLAGIRGCPGSQDGVGGDGTQDFGAANACAAQAALVPRKAQIQQPFGAMVFHYPSRSILLVEQGRLRRIQ